MNNDEHFFFFENCFRDMDTMKAMCVICCNGIMVQCNRCRVISCRLWGWLSCTDWLLPQSHGVLQHSHSLVNSAHLLLLGFNPPWFSSWKSSLMNQEVSCLLVVDFDCACTGTACCKWNSLMDLVLSGYGSVVIRIFVFFFFTLPSVPVWLWILKLIIRNLVNLFTHFDVWLL